MKRLASALIVAASLSGAPLFAQGSEMEQGLSMLELAAKNELSAIGLSDVDPMSLTLNQLAQIRSVMGSSDFNENEKTLQIRQIVGAN